MGIFDFLKKDKGSSQSGQMELPPVPEMEGVGRFPEPPKENMPELPEESLPPLPEPQKAPMPQAPMMNSIDGGFNKMEQDMLPLPKAPGALEDLAPAPVPPPSPATPKTDLPGAPSSPVANPSPKAQPMPEFPAEHMAPKGDLVPTKIPPLEGVPVPPKAEQKKIIEDIEDTPTLPEQDFIPAEEPVYDNTNYREIQERKIRKTVKGPLFIRAESLRDIKQSVEEASATFRTEDDVFGRITEVKNLQDTKLEDLRQTLEDLQRKLLFIDKTLFERSY